MSLLDHAAHEIRLLNEQSPSDDEWDNAVRTNALAIVKLFASQGHSGASASLTIAIATRLLNYQPLTPLTGADDEWRDVSEHGMPHMMFQNKRRSSIFKNAAGQSYDIDAGGNSTDGPFITFPHEV